MDEFVIPMHGFVTRIISNGIEAKIGPVATREILIEATQRFFGDRINASVLADYWRDGRAISSYGVLIMETVSCNDKDIITRSRFTELSEEEIRIKHELS